MKRIDEIAYKNIGNSLILLAVYVFVLNELESVNQLFLNLPPIINSLRSLIRVIALFSWIALILLLIFKISLDPPEYKDPYIQIVHKKYFLSDEDGFFNSNYDGWGDVKSISYDEEKVETSIYLNDGGEYRYDHIKWKYNGKSIRLDKLFLEYKKEWEDNYKEDGSMPSELRPFIQELININTEVKDIAENMSYTCDVDGRILTLMLESQNIVKLPETLCNLRHMISLDLINNNISELPTCIYKLEQLRKLLIFMNPIKKIPPGLSQLYNLELLFIEKEYFDKLDKRSKTTLEYLKEMGCNILT